MKKPWFRAKEYGWGWYPVTWEGWIATLAFIGVILGGLRWFGLTSEQADLNFVPFILFASFMVLIFILLATMTGERPEWKWGGKAATPAHVLYQTGILVLFILVAQLAGVIGSIATLQGIGEWYAGLAKPLLTPPAMVFAPIWSFLYLLMGLASYLVWYHGRKGKWRALILYAFHLVINAAWTIVFFGNHAIDAALVVLLLLDILIIWVMVEFYRQYKLAAYLLVPYLLWALFATYLNISFLFLNN